MTVVFPFSALKGLPDRVRTDRVKTLIRHIDRGRWAAHLLPGETPALAVAAYSENTAHRVELRHLTDQVPVRDTRNRAAATLGFPAAERVAPFAGENRPYRPPPSHAPHHTRTRFRGCGVLKVPCVRNQRPS